MHLGTFLLVVVKPSVRFSMSTSSRTSKQEVGTGGVDPAASLTSLLRAFSKPCLQNRCTRVERLRHFFFHGIDFISCLRKGRVLLQPLYSI